jgi:hypothetical protein
MVKLINFGNATLARSYTDSRAVFDVAAPGYSDFKVKVAFTDGGDTAKIIVTGSHTFSKDPDDPSKDSYLGYESILKDSPNLKVVITSDSFERLNSGDFDFDGLRWKAKDGIVRIVVPKTAIARGTSVEESKDDVNAPIKDEPAKKA